MLFTNIPDFYVQYHEALGLLRAEWGAVHGTRTLRPSAAQLLALTGELGVRRLLLDMNSVPNISAEDELWLGSHWMPAIVQSPLEQLILAIDSNRLHNHQTISALHDVVKSAIRFEAHYFDDVASALHWLTEGTSHLPALVAEWPVR